MFLTKFSLAVCTLIMPFCSLANVSVVPPNAIATISLSGSLPFLFSLFVKFCIFCYWFFSSTFRYIKVLRSPDRERITFFYLRLKQLILIAFMPPACNFLRLPSKVLSGFVFIGFDRIFSRIFSIFSLLISWSKISEASISVDDRDSVSVSESF